jgi:Flp pilus assembly pilin Flp
MNVMRRLMREDSGTTAVEYSVMLGFIMLVLIGSVAIFGLGQNSKWGGIWSVMRSYGM